MNDETLQPGDLVLVDHAGDVAWWRVRHVFRGASFSAERTVPDAPPVQLLRRSVLDRLPAQEARR